MKHFALLVAAIAAVIVAAFTIVPALTSPADASRKSYAIGTPLTMARGGAVAGTGRTTSALTPTLTSAPTAAGSGWRLAFTDNFNGTSLNQRWFAYNGQPGGDPAGQFSGSHVKVAAGTLTLRGYRDARYGNKLATAGVSTAHGYVQTYGKYLVRMRIASGKGVSFAALLWPVRTWPPEIDFAEDNGEPGRRTVTATTHWQSPTVKHGVSHDTLAVDMTKWHTVGVEWRRGSIVYTIDGKPWATRRGADVSSVPMALALQTQAWFCGHTWQRCPDSSTPANVDMDIDWVSVFSAA